MEEENEGSKEKYVKIFKPLLQNRGFLLLRIVCLISSFVYILVLFLAAEKEAKRPPPNTHKIHASH